MNVYKHGAKSLLPTYQGHVNRKRFTGYLSSVHLVLWRLTCHYISSDHESRLLAAGCYYKNHMNWTTA
ncbi:unnamed protein product [Clavelina lepadiformis]|uniref:Uncharacterized protein n=1 Tax=Clavelina lepadiformis TaxID=159417 RepID=A0ABP0G8J0_CLALP